MGWKEMTEPVSLEEYAAQQVREWAEQPLNLSGLAQPPQIAPLDGQAMGPPKTPAAVSVARPFVPPADDRDWHQLPQKPEAGEYGSGYYPYGTDLSGRKGTTANAQWGRGDTMRFITGTANLLARGKEETVFGVGNISLEGGKSFKSNNGNGHKGHISGLDVDVRPVRTDKRQEMVNFRDPKYDRAATQRLVDAMRATGQVEAIFFNDPLIKGVTPSDSTHDNHLHVKVRRGR